MNRFLVCSICLMCAISSTVFGQGSLTPSTAPAPGMKTLAQVEPRTPISSLPYSITNEGSFFVTSDLTGTSGTNGITVTADNVAIDLCGFTLTGAAGSASGIRMIDARFNVCIRNGALTAWTDTGIDAETVQNGNFLDLCINSNGDDGIKVGANCVVNRCTSTMNGDIGIMSDRSSSIHDCVSRSNGGFGFFVGQQGVITDCTAHDNGSVGVIASSGAKVSGCSASENNGDGFGSNGQNTFINCSANDNTGSGIAAQGGSLVKDCLSTYNTEKGINAAMNCHITGNTCMGNGATNGNAGIYAFRLNRIENNHLTENGIGLCIDETNNYVSGNTVIGNLTNYTIMPGNQLNLLISELPVAIVWPASVKLAGTLMGQNGQNGIIISSDDVTIDLAGHALIGVSGSIDGITTLPSINNITIKNGSVRNWGNDGIDLQGTANNQLTDIRAFSNGYAGVTLGDDSIISYCTAIGNSVVGINIGDDSSVLNCTAQGNATGIGGGSGSIINHCNVSGNHVDGITVMSGATISYCTARENGRGFYLNSNSSIFESAAYNNMSNGIETAYGCSIKSCVASANIAAGIQVSSQCHIKDNTCDYQNGDPCIYTTGSGNRIEGNQMTDSGIGLRVDSTGSLIIRNSASGNATAYMIAAGNRVGGIINLTGGGFTNNNPWVNFDF